MAKAFLKPGYEPVTGIYCGVKHRKSPGGEQLIYYLPLPDEDQVKNNPAARAEYIINMCVSDIQERMHSMQQAMEQYRAIRARVQRDYARYCNLEPDNNKLIKAIVNGYFQDRRKRPSKRQPQLELILI